MSNKFRNSKSNTIPKKILPPDAVRITKEDKTRVWLIGGREFESKADYFQYPNPVDRALCAEQAGQSPTSSGYTNNLGALRSLGVIDYPDARSVRAEPLLFLE